MLAVAVCIRLSELCERNVNAAITISFASRDKPKAPPRWRFGFHCLMEVSVLSFGVSRSTRGGRFLAPDEWRVLYSRAFSLLFLLGGVLRFNQSVGRLL